MSWMIAGGGTGGHFFPALEVAKAFRRLKERVFFVGVRRGIEAKLCKRYGFDLYFFPFEGLRGRGILFTLRALVKLPLAVYLAVKAIRRERVKGVFCTGGYTSFPAAVAAFIAGVPLYIHEQNSIPGWANLVAARLAKETWVSFEESAKYFFKKGFVKHTGNIVREEFRKSTYTLPPLDRFRLLVVGGSSGARTINRAVCDALPLLVRLGVSLRHQVGSLDREWVAKKYEESGAQSAPESFIEDMLSAYKWASFVVSRSGATTLFELSCVGRAALLIPYPYAVADHQKFNAMVLASRGAAICIDNRDLTGENLIRIIARFFFNKRLILRMSRSMYRSLKVFDVEKEVERLRNEVSL